MKKILSMAVLMLCVAQTVHAGGPFVVNEDGVASTWSSGAVELNPESGECASFSNSEMITKLENNMAHWTDITNIDLSISVIENVVNEDVNGDGQGFCCLPDETDGTSDDTNEDDGDCHPSLNANYCDYYVDQTLSPGLNDSINPVIFDEDAEIVSDIFGSSNKFVVLGFAGPDGFTRDLSTIVDGQAFFNCRCLDGNASGSCPEDIEFTEDDLDFTMVHEIGHMIGFDHTQVNEDTAEGVSCDLDSLGDCADIPTMYPQSVDAGDQITPQRDDQVIALTLYGDTTWEDDTCTVSGTLLDASGDTLRCADIQAETTDTSDTVAVVSGAFAPASDGDGDGYTDGDGECLSDCGDFALRGLDSAKAYTITVKPIDQDWVGGSSISPCGSDPDTGGTGQLTGIETQVIACMAGSSFDAGDCGGTAGVDVDCNTTDIAALCDTDVQIVGCGAGGTDSLGVVTTASTGGVTAGGGGDDEDTTTETTSISCALSQSVQGSSMAYVMMLMLALGVLALQRKFGNLTK